MRVLPLGAGQDVGRSCILVSLASQTVMFDCGMHMGYHDHRRFPDFSLIARPSTVSGLSHHPPSAAHPSHQSPAPPLSLPLFPTGVLTNRINAVIISHFHLDHCGALPYFTEMCGYDGPVIMTAPTRAVIPILLEDFRKICVEKKGEGNFFTVEHINNCLKKIIVIRLHETIQVNEWMQVTAYYAGHVLGAAMFHVVVRQPNVRQSMTSSSSIGDTPSLSLSSSESCVYTGDYNTTPDRHLGAAWIPSLRPDLLITETTYATTIRDSKRCRERDFLKRVYECVMRGGKVLIPVFALGRAQELCILLESFWERMNLTIPIYFSAGLAEKATQYYKYYLSWTNQKIKTNYIHKNSFNFNKIRAFDRAYMNQVGPMVLFATPGMLHAGLSLQVFKQWAPDPKNLIIIPGYCVVGTVGNKLTTGYTGVIEIDHRSPSINVQAQVAHLSFSAHADAKGIMQLIKTLNPKNVMLVHGEKSKMEFLKIKIQNEFGVSVYYPANGCRLTVDVEADFEVNATREFFLENSYQRGVDDECVDDECVDDGMNEKTLGTSKVSLSSTLNMIHPPLSHRPIHASIHASSHFPLLLSSINHPSSSISIAHQSTSTPSIDPNDRPQIKKIKLEPT